jgi:methylated-DNA-[protein]-cysteine S-methyltransferase
MSEAARHYHVFETAMGFCAIAWSDAGVARFQLPTRTAEAAERLMRRRAFDAEPGAPPEDVAAVIEAAKRYFTGEEIDFSNVRLDLDGQDAFFTQIYTALREVGWGSTTYGALAKEVGAGREAARDVGEAMAKNPAPLIIPVTGCWRPAARSAASPRPAARRRRCACSNWRAFAFIRQRQRNRLSVSEPKRSAIRPAARRLSPRGAGFARVP